MTPHRTHLSDDQITDVLREVWLRDGKLRGSAVRRRLVERFGQPGGVRHVYRLLAAHQHPALASETLEQRMLSAEEGRAAAEARAHLAEHREEAHQGKWMSTIDALRQELLKYKGMESKLADAQKTILALHRQVHELKFGKAPD